MDKRSLKTQENIKLTFLNILKDKEFSQITVSELCQKCGIHRKTFYAHYKNTADILTELFDGLINEISKLYTDMLIGAIGDFHIFFQYVNQYILKNLDFYGLLAKSSQYTVFIHRVDDYFTKNILARFDKDFRIYQSINKYTLYFLLSGIVSLYTYWISNSSECPITYISDVCEKMCEKTFGLKPLSEEEANYGKD